MHEFRIINKYNQYWIYYENEIVFTAIRGGSFWREKVEFFDHQKRLFAISKQTYFMILDLGHKLTFVSDNSSYKFKNNVFDYKGNIYKIKFGIFTRKPELYFNENVCGNYQLISNSVGKFECKISCFTYEQGWAFSILEVVLDWFDVN